MNAPERIHNWMYGHASIARFSGRITINGKLYIVSDEPGQPLVRADVLARERKVRKHRESRENAAAIENAREAQGDLL